MVVSLLFFSWELEWNHILVFKGTHLLRGKKKEKEPFLKIQPVSKRKENNSLRQLFNQLLKGKKSKEKLWLNKGWVLMSWVSNRIRDLDNRCIQSRQSFVFFFLSSRFLGCSIGFLFSFISLVNLYCPTDSTYCHSCPSINWSTLTFTLDFLRKLMPVDEPVLFL